MRAGHAPPAGDGGRAEEFRAWVLARREPLRRTAFLLCGDWHLADDLVQDALARVWPRWSRISSSGEPDAYVRKAVVNLYLDHRRRPFRREVLASAPADLVTAGAPGGPGRQPVIAGPDLGERERLLSALARIAPGQRAVLVLRYWDDLSIEQTAGVLGRSRGHVKSQAARGLANLRQALQGDAPEATDPPVPAPVHQSHTEERS